MMYKCFGRSISVPDALVKQYTKDFDVLPQSGKWHDIHELRDSIYQIMLLVQLDPSMLDEPAYLGDFTNALAMKKALENNGIMYDA